MTSLVRLFCMILWAILLMLIAPIFILFTFNRQFPLIIARTVFAPVLMRIVGIKLTSIGNENIPVNEPVIFIANHCSHIDIACLCKSLPVNLHFIGKKELMWIPVLGWYMFITGHIFIDRSNHKKAIQSIKKAAKKIKQGKSVVIYPEGTRSKTGKIQPFKKGAFHLAIEAKVKIVPVCIKGTHNIWPPKSYTITPGNVNVNIGKPIDASLYTKQDLNKLVNHAQLQIEEMLSNKILTAS